MEPKKPISASEPAAADVSPLPLTDAAHGDDKTDVPPPSMTLALRGLRLVLILGLVATAGTGVWAWRGKADAKRWALRGDFVRARSGLRRYLWLFPRDAEARLQLARALATDDALLPKQRWPEAFALLQSIDDRTPQGFEARMCEARLAFLVRLQPTHAEQLVRRALALKPKSRDAWFLLWKILDMTGRGDESETVFQQVLALAAADERTWCLREWFLSQFAPGLANADLDRALGFLKPDETAGPACEFQRLLAFRNAERSSPLNHAALARWFERQGDFEQALKILRESSGLPGAYANRYFVFALVETYLKAGQADLAEKYFVDCPGDRAGYEYWRLQGILHEEAHRDYAQAVTAYDRAMMTWPGPADWRTVLRKAQCLRALGKADEAEQCRAAGEKIRTDLFGAPNQKALLDAAARLTEPRQLDVIAGYYMSLGRRNEAALWRKASPLTGNETGFVQRISN